MESQALNSGVPSIRSPVAQLVEQAAVNRLVAGSSPARGAKSLKSRRTKVWWLFSSWPRRPFDEEDQRVGAAQRLVHHPFKSSSILEIRAAAAFPWLPALRTVSGRSEPVRGAGHPRRGTTGLRPGAARCRANTVPALFATHRRPGQRRLRRFDRRAYRRMQREPDFEGGRTQPVGGRSQPRGRRSPDLASTLYIRAETEKIAPAKGNSRRTDR
jgi:hypothetical protein